MKMYYMKNEISLIAKQWIECISNAFQNTISGQYTKDPWTEWAIGIFNRKISYS